MKTESIPKTTWLPFALLRRGVSGALTGAVASWRRLASRYPHRLKTSVSEPSPSRKRESRTPRDKDTEGAPAQKGTTWRTLERCSNEDTLRETRGRGKRKGKALTTKAATLRVLAEYNPLGFSTINSRRSSVYPTSFTTSASPLCLSPPLPSS